VPVTVTTDDVATALVRPLTTAETPFVSNMCDQAVVLIAAAMPTLAARVAAYEADADDPTGINPALVSAVLAGVVKRALVNPKGLVSSTSATGPYSASETYANRTGATSDGSLAILPSDLAKLNPAAPVVAGTIRLRPHPVSCELRRW
jgi:hypothetical protein